MTHSYDITGHVTRRGAKAHFSSYERLVLIRVVNYFAKKYSGLTFKLIVSLCLWSIHLAYYTRIPDQKLWNVLVVYEASLFENVIACL